MGRPFLSLDYDVTPVVVPLTLPPLDDSDDEASHYPTPKKWSPSDPFDPDAEEFFVREDAVFEAFIPEDAPKPFNELPPPTRVIFVGDASQFSEDPQTMSRSASASPTPDLGHTMRAAGWEMVMPQLPVSSNPTTIPMADQNARGTSSSNRPSIITPDTPISIPVASDQPPATQHSLRAPAVRPANLPPFGARVRDSTIFGRILRAATAQAGADGTAIPPELLHRGSTNEPLLVPFTPPTSLSPNPTSTPSVNEIHASTTMPSLNFSPPMDERVVRAWRAIIQARDATETPEVAPPPPLADTVSGGYAPLR